jgi:hypothetical protein
VLAVFCVKCSWLGANVETRTSTGSVNSWEDGTNMSVC